MSYFLAPQWLYENLHLFNPTPEDILNSVSKRTGISVQQIKSPNRKREIVSARYLAIFIIKQKFDLSLKAIGRLFGGRDHSTIIHSVDTFKDVFGTNANYRRQTLPELRKWSIQPPKITGQKIQFFN